MVDGNGVAAQRWESWFKVIFSILMSIIAFIGVVLWNKVDSLDANAQALAITTTRLTDNLQTETQARSGLSGKVDNLTTTVQGLSDEIAHQPPPLTVVQRERRDGDLDKKLDKLSRQMYSLQSQLDDAASARNKKGGP